MCPPLPLLTLASLAQAVALALEGYSVVGTDVGLAEVKVATKYAEEKSVQHLTTFLQDDILDGVNSKLTNHSFDVVIDRAVFHSMAPFLENEPLIKLDISLRFAERIRSLLKPGGLFLFKGMSEDEQNFRVDDADEDAMYEINAITVFEAMKHLAATTTDGKSLKSRSGRLKLEKKYVRERSEASVASPAWKRASELSISH